MRSLYLGTAVMLLLLHRVAGAVDLVPLTVTPVSIEARANEASSGVQTNNTASVTLFVSEEGLDAVFSVTGTIENNTIMYSGSLLVTRNSDRGLAGTGLVLVTVRIEIPFVGGAMTPVIAVIENVTTELVGDSTSGLARLEPVFPSIFSSSVGEPYSGVAGLSAFADENTAMLFHTFGGDTVDLSLRLTVAGNASPGVRGLALAVGEVNKSFMVSLYTVGTAPGASDLNADGLTDILDATLLRRSLAGLPTN